MDQKGLLKYGEERCNLVSFHRKSLKLGQMITLDVIFHVVVSIYRLFKI